MLRKMYYFLAHLLLWPSLAAALPQVVSQSSQAYLTAAASPTESPTIQNTTSTSTTLQTSTPTDNASNASSHKCDFDSMQNFFDYSAERGLDITIEVQNCQNLCLLVYGVGNPDLSGIGVRYPILLARQRSEGPSSIVPRRQRLLHRCLCRRFVRPPIAGNIDI
jgi:hypothetical protein